MGRVQLTLKADFDCNELNGLLHLLRREVETIAIPLHQNGKQHVGAQLNGNGRPLTIETRILSALREAPDGLDTADLIKAVNAAPDGVQRIATNSIIVGPFSANVGRHHRIFSAHLGLKRRMLSGQAVYVLGPLQLASSESLFQPFETRF